MADEQPIIIKKKKKGGHGGHHGGAWKVAYADFVTAMMAFFLVMWILGLSPTSKKRIANFFRDPGIFAFSGGKRIPLDMDLVAGAKGNEGNGNGTKGMMQTDKKNKHNDLHESAVDSVSLAMIKEQAVADSIHAVRQLEQVTENIKQKMMSMAKSDTASQQLINSLKLTVTNDGLRIEMIESKENVFFQSGSANLSKEGYKILQELGKQLSKLNNTITLEGHTDSKQYTSAKNGGYSNWELSADRANSARRALEQSGLWTGQVTNVTGYADRKLYNPMNPFDVMNRRVSIMVSQIRAEDLVKESTQKIIEKQVDLSDNINRTEEHQEAKKATPKLPIPSGVPVDLSDKVHPTQGKANHSNQPVSSKPTDVKSKDSHQSKSGH